MDYYGINIVADVSAEGSPDIASVSSPIGTMYGEATSAQWGDLAEKYSCKGNCEPGTVMSVCGDEDADAEECKNDLCVSVIGVISEKPAFKMNEKLAVGKFIALTGRVPVKIIGPIEKSDFIVATESGCARAGQYSEIAHRIGVALETNSEAGVKLVECVIK